MQIAAEEFKAKHASGHIKMGATLSSLSSNTKLSSGNFADLPDHVDWRDRGIITAPKNQLQCGSCWAFSAVEQVESYLALNTGNLTNLSPQELVSCMPNPLNCGGTGGCYGATHELAYQFTQAFGLVS